MATRSRRDAVVACLQQSITDTEEGVDGQAGDAMAFGTVTVPGGAGSGGGGGGIPGAAAPVMNGGEPEVRASTRVPSNNVVCCYPAASNVCPSHKGVCVSLSNTVAQAVSPAVSCEPSHPSAVGFRTLACPHLPAR